MRSAAAGGQRGRGLPAGIQLGDLLAAKVEAIPATHDIGNPRLQCEFFDTRQARTQNAPVALLVPVLDSSRALAPINLGGAS